MECAAARCRCCSLPKFCDVLIGRLAAHFHNGVLNGDCFWSSREPIGSPCVVAGFYCPSSNSSSVNLKPPDWLRNWRLLKKDAPIRGQRATSLPLIEPVSEKAVAPDWLVPSGRSRGANLCGRKPCLPLIRPSDSKNLEPLIGYSHVGNQSRAGSCSNLPPIRPCTFWIALLRRDGPLSLLIRRLEERAPLIGGRPLPIHPPTHPPTLNRSLDPLTRPIRGLIECQLVADRR